MAHPGVQHASYRESLLPAYNSGHAHLQPPATPKSAIEVLDFSDTELEGVTTEKWVRLVTEHLRFIRAL